MFGQLTNEEIEALLKTQIVARLGLHDSRTYVVPISYAYDGEQIYFHSLHGLKTTMMRNNPEVCIQVDEMKNMSDWNSVICWGKAKELTSREDRTRALQVLTARELPIMSSETTHLLPNWPFSSVDEKDVKGLLFSVRISEKTGRFERSDIADKCD